MCDDGANGLTALLRWSTARGFDRKLNLSYVDVCPDRVEARIAVDETLCQPAGIVHGGVFASIVEAVGPAGAYAHLLERGDDEVFVGTSNTTDFLRAVSDGSLSAIGVPVHQGGRTQLWEVEIREEIRHRLVSRGVLRGQNLPDRRKGGDGYGA